MTATSIMTILPSGIHELVHVHPNFILELEANKKLFNAIIGPILNRNDLEAGFKYYIYCRVENYNPFGKNFFMTDLIQKVYPDIYITGQIYIVKKVDLNKIVDIEDKDVGTIFDILCHADEQDIKIKRFILNQSYNDKEIESYYDPFYSLCSWLCL